MVALFHYFNHSVIFGLLDNAELIDLLIWISEYGLTYWMAPSKDIIPPKWKSMDPSATMKIVISFMQTEYATFIHKGRKTNTGNACNA